MWAQTDPNTVTRRRASWSSERIQIHAELFRINWRRRQRKSDNIVIWSVTAASSRHEWRQMWWSKSWIDHIRPLARRTRVSFSQLNSSRAGLARNAVGSYTRHHVIGFGRRSCCCMFHTVLITASNRGTQEVPNVVDRMSGLPTAPDRGIFSCRVGLHRSLWTWPTNCHPTSKTNRSSPANEVD